MTIPYPEKMEAAIDEAYEKLVEEYGTSTSWAVRSSATAEDLPDASFAGQQETFLNVSGLDHIKFAIREVFASCLTIGRLPIVITKDLNTAKLLYLPVFRRWSALTLLLPV